MYRMRQCECVPKNFRRSSDIRGMGQVTKMPAVLSRSACRLRADEVHGMENILQVRACFKVKRGLKTQLTDSYARIFLLTSRSPIAKRCR